MTAPTHPAPRGADPVRSVAFVSLGCPKNLVDSEKMLGLLAHDGIVPVSSETERGGADAIVINTCGFLEASKEESLQVIRDAIRRKEAGEFGRVVVAGCLVQRHRDKMLEWAPGIDAMVGVFDRDQIVRAVRGGEGPRSWVAANALVAAKERGRGVVGLTVNGKDGKGIGYFEDDSARLRLTPRHYAYLRVSEGCNQNCAFCTIPSIRGKMRSKPLDRIVSEARELLNDGAFELNLIGQDTTSYGDDIGFAGGLPAMLGALNDVVEAHGDGWVRLMYAYPSTFSGAMIDAIAGLARVVKYIDMPLQHASDRMLAAMRRNVTASQQRDLILRLRERIPGMAIRTTFISGFPGETEADHEALLAFIDEIGFDALGVFEYSAEDHTPAGTMERDAGLRVPPEVKARRRGEVMQAQQRIAFEQAEFLAGAYDEASPGASGHQFDVLIDRATATRGRATSGVGAEGRLYQGRAYFQAPEIDSVTYVRSEREITPGERVRCVVVASDGYDLVARPVG